MFRIPLTRALLSCGAAMLLFSLFSCGSDGGSEPDVSVETVTVTPESATIAPDGTVQLQASTLGADGATLSGRDITWSSSDDGVATVSSDGVVTGIAIGSAIITATSEGKSGTATIEVEVPVVAVVVSPEEATIAVSETVQLSALTLDAEGNELPGRVVELVLERCRHRQRLGDRLGDRCGRGHSDDHRHV